jgi:hypothetical protein
MAGSRTFTVALACVVPVCVDACSSSSGQTDPITGCKQLAITNLLQSPLPAGGAYGGVVSDGQNVYFSDIRSLYRVPISGGAAETVYAGPFGGQFGAAGGTVAWVPLMSDNVTPAGLTVENASGPSAVVLPDGVQPVSYEPILVDDEGNVFFEVTLPTGGPAHTWRWSGATNSAGEMPGVGMPETGAAGTNLYWVDRGEIVWSNNIDGPAAGIYITDVSTGVPRQLAGTSNLAEFGGLLGVDEKNLYGMGSSCPKSACPFTAYGVARDGSGTPFVAYQTADAYWTASPPQTDDSGIYWMDWNTPGIYHAAIAIGAPASLVAPLPRIVGNSIPATFARDACNLYWITTDSTGAPSVMAMSK